MSQSFAHNTFRYVDAAEYIDAYRHGVKLPADIIADRKASLAARMSENPPTYLLAAYRGYEDAEAFVTRRVLPSIVKINDLDPTPIS